ncbi:hypothetical protein BCR22_07355 [Enterococcus plantarum]|uniref:DUF4355 domain-containing protein n=1 Tax=Enterococcus plantarum TaxID=1077675 RepID=UPI00084CE8FB|nr:DUF4355 domain-containing protein [Enterococcus plantarum]OEG09403.1 hypothetical protein BCR22_07355 [Enterococcus plantarum]
MKRKKLGMNLQFFAEDTGSNGGGDNPDNTTNGEIVEKAKDEQETNESDKKYSDEDVNKIIDAKFAKWKAEQQKEQDEAKKLAEMDDKEKTDYEKQKLQEEVDNLRREKTLAKMAKRATSMLADKGVQASEGILSFVVKESAEATSESVKAFIELIDAEREVIKADFEKRLGSKLPMDGTTSTTLSRGAQMAKAINNQSKKPEFDPWATK